MAGRDDYAASLGDIIRRQRELAELPMRQLAAMVGISNPYLSQIERGLREPSAQVLEAIAGSLRTSADVLIGAARGPEEDQRDEQPVVAAIREDQRLTASQRQALLETYQAFVEVTEARRHRRGRPRSNPTAQTQQTRDP